MRRSEGVEVAEDGALDLQILGDRLDDEVGGGHRRTQIRRHRDAAWRLAGGFGGDAPCLDQPAEPLGDPGPRSLELGLALVVEGDLVPMRGKLERDAVPHQPGADDADPRDPLPVFAHLRSAPLPMPG